MVLAPGYQQQRSAAIVFEIDRRRRMWIEIRQGGLKENVVRTRHGVPLVDVELLFLAQIVREGVVKLLRR